VTAPTTRRDALATGLDRQTLVVAAVAVVGTALLAARPALVAVTSAPVALLAVLFAAILLAGAGLPLPAPARAVERATGRRATLLVVLVGALAFGVGRVLVGGHPPTSTTLLLVATNSLAAVAEEAWFRRLWFGLLAPAGDGIAIVGSTILFAAVHVSIYGYWVLPLDLAAGLLFAWQRSTTGSWAAPAVTHVIANLMVVL
jgi:hypothetical protein